MVGRLLKSREMKADEWRRVWEEVLSRDVHDREYRPYDDEPVRFAASAPTARWRLVDRSAKSALATYYGGPGESTPIRSQRSQGWDSCQVECRPGC